MASARSCASFLGVVLVLLACVSVCYCAYKETDGVVQWRKPSHASRLFKPQTRDKPRLRSPPPQETVQQHHHSTSSSLRVKRAVTKHVVERTTRENRTSEEIIFTLSSEFLNSTREYAMTEPDSPFTVDQGGNVRLKPGREAVLDYDKDDFDDKIMLVFVNATNRNNRADVVVVEVRLQVTDINDENPEFTNRPVPYLATVAATAPAGTLVFPLVAQDRDTGSNLNYTLQSGGENRFELDIKPEFDAELRRSIKVAFIRTKGSGRFEEDKVYRLLVSARDYGATDTIQEALATVEVLVGIRPPQFYNATYHGFVRENSGIGQTLSNQLRVSAKSFQNKTVTYTLLDQNNQTATQFLVEADGTIKTRESFDFESVPRAQRPLVKVLHVIAKERDTNLESMARLEVEIVDDNDNSPMFDLSTYRTLVKEDVAVGTDIMSVVATDDDFGANAELVYSVNNGNFSIETLEERGRYVGKIRVAAPLDYDRLLSHMHSFTVTAMDKGSPPRSGTAEVRVSLENVNDEPPEFRLSSFVFNLREDSPVKSVVTVVQAIDLDGDNINYYFTPNRNRDGIFSISQDSGLIRVEEDIPNNVDMYTLNITAQDDGSCCPGNRRLQNETFIVLEIMDINLHKPQFPNCTTYNSATLPEKSPPGTDIIQVKAIDQDRGINGDITYEIVISDRQVESYFRIDPNSGQLSTDQMFDRETTKFLSVTVKARDHGNPQLEGYCTFQVKISDINDNPPRFDQNSYKAAISENLRPGGSVLSIRAYDADEGNNAQVSYQLTQSQDGLFAIESNSGIISLAKPLTGAKSYDLTVVAKDNGSPSLNSTVNVLVEVADLTSKPPRWKGNYDALAYEVNETVPRGFVIATFEAESGITANPIVDFGLIDERGFPSAQYEEFLIQKVGTSVNLLVTASLDILKKKKVYDLRLRVTNRAPMPLYAEIHPQIIVKDTNNQVPQFVVETDGTIPGSAQENMNTRQIVADVRAFDLDEDPPNNELTFELGEDPEGNYRLFDIEQKEPNMATITTTHVFDRETKAQYYLTVIVKDSAPSTLYANANKPNEQQGTLKVEIADQNDNAPYFERTEYSARIREDAGINSRVLQVHAIDKDETAQLTYQITAGNTRNAFVIQDRTGDIFVGRQLDYETEQHEYNLTVSVTDTVFSNTTLVHISVLDVNDNPPQFTQADYVVTDVVEEVPYSRSNKKFLLNVSATDGDKDRNTQMRYSLLGYGTMGEKALFEIDAQTGSLYLIGKLDRDAPNGFTDYQFNVQAEDERENPLTGIANINIRPKDVNDNWPVFNKLILEGHLFEHSPIRTPVMTVVATDYDYGDNGTVVYSISQAPVAKDHRMFRIKPDTGEIYTNVGAEEFDREVTAKYELTVEARDLGPESSEWPNLNPRNVATVRIILDDINDKWPVFYKKVYQFTMSEAQTSGQVAVVKAMDEDIDYNAKLEYSLNGTHDLQHFSINTINNEGFINVFRPVDFEAGQTFFNLTVKVQDPNVTHVAYAYVEITVQDFNDNAPKFSRSSDEVFVKENVAVGTFLARFEATDADTGINKEFEYSIDRSTDRLRQFEIDSTGNVRVGRKLDRETQEVHYLRILAIDKGDPPQNGSATLVVHVEDVNDNFPVFREKYEPHVREHDPELNKLLVEVFGEDPDTLQFGPPFGFASPNCSQGSPSQCPCPDNPTCDKFSLEFKPDRAGGNGTALIRTLQEFDREKNKYFLVPIVMWDMRGKGSSEAKTGTNMLKVIIADINDNQHNPGHQDILVYNYKGQFGPVVIGSVYAEDADDWDIPDKRFYFTGADYLKSYFTVDERTGAITMHKGVPGDEDYTFTVRVQDVVWNKDVESSVTIRIKDLPEEAVLNSGAVRLTGMTAEEFVKRPKNGSRTSDYGDSPYARFRRLLATKLGVPLDNVDIVSIMEGQGHTDVRYAAHGSPWYAAAKTDGVIAYNRAEFEQVAGVKIGQVPLDECIKEQFEGGCYNRLVITGRPVVVNTNGTSYVGVETAVVATQGCRADRFPDPIECTPNYCYNGGVCKKDLWGVLMCDCPYGFRGPRCQGTHHSFSGSQFLLLPALEQCQTGSTSVEFITKSPNGILLYNGPVSRQSDEAPQDFILLELRGGFPRLRIDHGTGELVLTLDGTDRHGNQKMHALNDGKWHRIDIVRHGKEVELTVDHCKDATTEQEVVVDDRPCRGGGVTPGENVFLNVHSLLQLGGLYVEKSSPPTYPRNLPAQGFDGCVKNLIHNGKMYNLHVAGKPDYPSGENNCPREDAICGANSLSGPKCGQHGQCVTTWLPDDFTCICDPGWRDSPSQRCGTKTTIKDLKANSYLRWRLKDTFFSALGLREIAFQAMFRTRDPDGVILTMSTPDNTRFITLELLNGHLQVSYNLGDGSQTLVLTEATASDGQWHTVYVTRVGQAFTLRLDGGEGRNYATTQGHPNGHAEINIQNFIYAGASVSESKNQPVIASDLNETCIQDIRMENRWFPLTRQENTDSPAAVLLDYPHIEDDCVRNDCPVGICNTGNELCYPDCMCIPLWGLHQCGCPPGYILAGTLVRSGCVEIDYCASQPCGNNGTCENVRDDPNRKFRCICPPGWTGDVCMNVGAYVTQAGLTTGAIVAIIVCIFIVLVLTLVVILLVRFTTKTKDDKYILEVDPEDDIRENVMNYDEEGAGEEDQDGYDISRLRKPEDGESLSKSPVDMMPHRMRPLARAPGDYPDVGSFITDRLQDADDDQGAPPYDSVMDFAYEGEGSDAGSLSSLNTSSSGHDHEYDYLNDWGPKFSKLADMYGPGQEED